MYMFLTGSYASREEAGICLFSFSPETGFCKEKSWSGFLNPSFILLHPKLPVLYSIEETSPEGMIHAWDISGPAPVHISSFSAGGADPCHICLSPDQRLLFVSNYSGGSLAIFVLDSSGRILQRASLLQHTGCGADPIRQEKAHVHCCAASEDLLYVCDLGTDTICVYDITGYVPIESLRITLPAGSGPRHLTLSGDKIYCITELSCHILVFQKIGKKVRLVQDMPVLKDADLSSSTGAAIHILPGGKKLAVSIRGRDCIAVFSLFPDGRLSSPVISDCPSVPRDFLATGNYILVGSQSEDVIHAFQLDDITLQLRDTGFYAKVPAPVCLCEKR